MSTRAEQYVADVLRREQLSPHLVRLTLGGSGLAGFTSTGVPDEWVGLIVPGQFQSRYYTVRSWDGRELVLDVVVHEVGLVTEWATRDCVGDQVTVTEPRGSFAMPEGAGISRTVRSARNSTARTSSAACANDGDAPGGRWSATPTD